MNSCPFKVGDKITSTPLKATYPDGDGFTTVEYPSVWPDAIVTEITADGFKYEYDEIFHAHPRLGLSFAGGTCFPAGYHIWKFKA